MENRGPQALDHRPVAVRGLLGTGPHSRGWAVGEWAKLHLYLQSFPTAGVTGYRLSSASCQIGGDIRFS